MAALTSQSILQTGATPAPITPAASDTIASGQFGATGCSLRVITTGTGSNITVADPNTTALGNAGTAAVVAAPATGVRVILIPRAAINPATDVATVTSSSQAGMTYELWRI